MRSAVVQASGSYVCKEIAPVTGESINGVLGQEQSLNGVLTQEQSINGVIDCQEDGGIPGVPGLPAHFYDAGSIDGQGNATLTNGQKVQRWINLGVAAGYFEQTVVANQPTYFEDGGIGSNPGLFFDRLASQSWMDYAQAVAIPQPAVIAHVSLVDHLNGAASVRFFDDVGADFSDRWAGGASAANVIVQVNLGLAVGKNLTRNNHNKIVWKIDGGNSEIHVNDLAGDTGLLLSGDPLDSLRIHRRADTEQSPTQDTIELFAIWIDGTTPTQVKDYIDARFGATWPKVSS